jgi:hypothetical protein
MEMRVELELLVPSMKHRGKSHLSPKPFIPSGQLKKGPGGSVKQEVIEQFFVLQDQRVELMGEGEDYVEVMGWQQPFCALVEPSCLLEILAFGAVAIAAGIV